MMKTSKIGKFLLYVTLGIVIVSSVSLFPVSADTTAAGNFWTKAANGQLYTNSGNGLGNAIINVAGCNGCGGGGGGSPTIGLPVIGGSPTDVLFIDHSGNLAQDDGFQYDSVHGIFTVGFSADGSLGLLVQPTSGDYGIGDLSNVYNGTSIEIEDTNFLTTFYGVAGATADVDANQEFPNGTNPGYTGSGANNMTWSGILDDLSNLPNTITVQIDSIGTGTVTYTGLTGGTFAPGDTITGGTSGAAVTVVSDDGAGNMVTKDQIDGISFTVGETIDNGSGVTAVVSDSTDVADDTFAWSDTNGNSNSGQDTKKNADLEGGIILNFSEPYGHDLSDTWVWTFSKVDDARELAFDGFHANFLIGDLDGTYKSQQFGIESVDDQSDWDFRIFDGNGTYFRVHPVDAPLAGEYQLGDIDETHNGTYLDMNDRMNNIGFRTNYDSISQVQLFGIIGGDTNLQRGTVFIGDKDDDVNGTYVVVRDNSKDIEAHANIELGLDAYINLGTTEVTPTGGEISGVFNSVQDGNSGGEGFAGVGAYDGLSGVGDDAVISAHFDSLGNGVTQALYDDSGEPTMITASDNATAGTSMRQIFRSDSFEINDRLIGGILFRMDQITGTVTLNAPIINLSGGIQESSVSIVAYGTVTTITPGDGTYDYEITGSSGAGSFVLPTGSLSPIGTTYVFKDLGLSIASNNITLNAGTSNFIVGTSSAQTFVMASNGESVTIKKVTATQWAVE